MPNGCYAILYAMRRWGSGKPVGVAISSTQNMNGMIITSIPDDVEYAKNAISASAVVDSGTYYLLSKSSVTSSGNSAHSSEKMHAIIFGNKEN